MQDINLYKGTHPDELYPNATEEQMKSVFHRNHPQYTENYYLALEQIIKQRKGRPLIALLLIFVQYLLYTSMFGHLYTIGPYYVSHGQLLYYLSIIILVLRLWNKKRVWIKVCFVLLLSISYRFLPSATLLFICYTSFFSLAMTWYGKIRRRSHK